MSKNFKILRGPTEEETDKIFKKLPPDEMLYKAAHYGSLKWVKEALSRGANIHEGRDFALRHAAGNGHLEVVKFLLDHGANKHEHNNEALRYAIANNHTKIAELLLHSTTKYSKGNIYVILTWSKYHEKNLAYKKVKNFFHENFFNKNE